MTSDEVRVLIGRRKEWKKNADALLKEAARLEREDDAIIQAFKGVTNSEFDEAMSEPAHEVGDWVIFSGGDNGDECGVVIHTWIDNGVQDCYVAFFGDKFPTPKSPTATKPYVLRYYASSLRKAL